MSVISDALKAAQRERARRESGAAPRLHAPVLVPLRAMSETSFDWKRMLMIALAGALAVAAVGIATFRGPRNAPLPAMPAVTSTILSEAIAADSADKVAKVPSIRDWSDRHDTHLSRAPEVAPSRVVSTQREPTEPAISRRQDTVAVLQGRSRAAVVAGGAPFSPERGVQSTGTLRIAVEPPRQLETGQLFSEAIAAHRAGDLPTARSLYERVLLIAPNDPDALNNLGVLLSSQREFGHALELLRRAASVAPRNAGTWNNIGTVLREQGRGSDAIAAFRHALTIDPRHGGARVGLAQQYLAINALADAKEILDEALAINPSLAEAQYTLGQVLELQGDRAGAIRAYSAFVRIAPARFAEHVGLVRKRIDALSARSP